jgi:GxxExxY protein
MPESDLLYHDLTRTIIGAFFQAHRELGSGFLEAIYKNGLAVLLRRAGLRVEREVPDEIILHGESLGTYRADIVVERKVVVE